MAAPSHNGATVRPRLCSNSAPGSTPIALRLDFSSRAAPELSVAEYAPDPRLAVVPHLPALLVTHTEHPLVRARRLLRAHADERQ